MTAGTRIGRFALALFALALLAAPARAQQPAEPDEGTPGRERRGWRRDWGSDATSRPQHRGHQRGHGMARPLLRITPEDRQPLAEGELEELLAFLGEHMPKLAEELAHQRTQDPAGFEEQLARRVPRLRQLRRLFTYSPEIAEVFRAHARVEFDVRVGIRSLRRIEAGTALYQQAVRDLRKQIAAGVQLEIQMLDVYATELDAHREERAAEVVAYLIVPEAELAAEPPDVRKWVAAYHAAEDTSARDAVLAQLDEIARARVAGEITALHERAEQMRAGAAEEVDKRISDLLDRGPRGPRGPRGGRPH